MFWRRNYANCILLDCPSISEALAGWSALGSGGLAAGVLFVCLTVVLISHVRNLFPQRVRGEEDYSQTISFLV